MTGKILQFGQALLSHKKALFGAAFLVLLLSLVPLQIAQANVFTDILEGIVTFPFRVIAALLVLVLFILALVGGLLFVLLGGILSEFILGTLSTPVVPGQGISVVDFGWDFSRDIVNLIFIVVIVFIGLATILRLQSYQLQRTLPALVIVALLVNFSAVFVGFIVDISNLVIGVFIDEFAGFSVANLKAFVWDGPTNYLTNSFDQLFTEWSGGILGALGTIVGAVLYGIVLLLFNIIGALILFVVFLLFLARVIILWVLAILAPLAFGAYILPATRRFWDQWLQQLVQWSIIGVPLGLFLVLAKQVFDNPVASIIPGLSSDPSISADAIVGTMNSFIAQAFSPMVGLALMLVGVMLSMQMAPAGAAKIISLGKKWGVAAGLATGSGLWRRFEGKDIRQGGGRVSRFGAALSERAKTLGMAPEGSGFLRKTLAGGMKVGPGAIARLAGRGIELGGKELTMRVATKDAQEQDKAAKEVASKDSFSVFNMVNEELSKGRLANWNRITGLLNGVRARGDGDDIEAALDNKVLPEKLLGRAIKTGLRAGPPGYRPLLKSFFSRVMLHPEEFGFKASVIKNEKGDVEGFEGGEDAAFLNRELKSLPTKYNAQDFQGDTLAKENFNMDSEEGKFFVKTIVKERGSDFLAQMGRRPRKEESQKIMQYIFKEGEFTDSGLGDDWLLENGAESVLRYIDSPGARSLGIGAGRNRTDIDNMIKQWEQKQTRRDLTEKAVRLQQSIETASGKTKTKLTRQLDAINASLQDFDTSIEDLGKEMAVAEKEVQNIDNIPEKEFTAAKAQAKIAAQKRIEQIRQVLRGKRPAAGRATSTANLTGAINEAAEKVRAKEMEVQAAQRAVEELAGVGPIEGTAEQAAIDSAYEANEAQVREKQQRQQQLEQYQQELQHLQQQEQYLQGYRGLIEQTAKIEGPRRASAVEKKQFAQIAGVGTGQPQSIPFSGTPASRLQRAPDTELDSALRKIHGAQRALADVLEERYKELQNLYAQQERLRADPSADANVIANVERQASDTQNRIGQQRTRWEELVASEDRVAAEYNSSARVAKRQGPRGK